MRGKLQPLRLATGQRRQRLAQTHILQTDRSQRGEAALELFLRAKKFYCFSDRKVKNVGETLAVIADFQHLLSKTFALTFGARDIHVREKLHLDFFRAFAFARLTASAFNVERECTRCIPPDTRQFGLRQ